KLDEKIRSRGMSFKYEFFNDAYPKPQNYRIKRTQEKEPKKKKRTTERLVVVEVNVEEEKLDAFSLFKQILSKYNIQEEHQHFARWTRIRFSYALKSYEDRILWTKIRLLAITILGNYISMVSY